MHNTHSYNHEPSVCMLIFILTYGFIGLEAACIEMSDPFGDGANHFDYITLAKVSRNLKNHGHYEKIPYIANSDNSNQTRVYQSNEHWIHRILLQIYTTFYIHMNGIRENLLN